MWWLRRSSGFRCLAVIISDCYYIRLLLYPTTVIISDCFISECYYIQRLFLYPTLTAYVRTPFLSMRVFLLPKLSHADFLGVVLKIFFTIKNFPACFKLSFALVNSVINLKTLFVNLVFTCFFNLKFFFF